MRARSIVGAGLVVGLAVAGAAQGPDAPVPPHTCRFGPASNVATLPPARPMAGIGTSHLTITTAIPEAQQFFDQGLNLLHAFWDTEAYRAFREAARLDPEAAMPHWGIFVALGQNAQEMSGERASALATAVALAGRASEHEQGYIRAYANLADASKGRPAFISDMEALIDRYPSDIEAQLLLANTLSTPVGSYAPDGRPREGKLYGQAILRNLLRTHPGHAAVHHYWIHAVENGPRPEDALDSAAALPTLAPASGHMLHMPGHIYYRLGRYGDARDIFLRSLAFDEAYMAREQMSPVNTWNYIHNLDYLIATSAENGRFAEGLEYATRLAAIPVDPARRRAQGLGYLTFGGRTAVARLQMRYGRWSDAAATLAGTLGGTLDEEVLARGYYSGVAAYARGMAAVASDAADRAQAALAELDALYERLAPEKIQAASDWYFRHGLRVLNVNRLELRGAIESIRGNHTEALRMLGEAATREKDLGYWEPPHYARPVLESLGDAARRARTWDAARAAYSGALKLRPNSGHALLGIARTEFDAGRTAESRTAYEAVLRAWAGADRDLPEVREARTRR